MERTSDMTIHATDKYNTDDLAEMFGLPKFETLEESNLDYTWECGAQAVKELLVDEPDTSEDDQDTVRYDAEAKVQTALFHGWHDALMGAVEKEFEAHGLKLVPVPVKGKTPEYPYEYRVKALDSWEKAATMIAETICGVGYFHFASAKELCDSGPYTMRGAVLNHLHYLRRRAEVYGDYGAEYHYDRNIQHALRYL